MAAVAILVGAVLAACTGKTPEIAGDWTGAMQAGGKTRQSVLHVKTEGPGNLSVSLDIPEDRVMGLPGANVVLNGGNFSFDIPSVRGTYSGTVSSDGKTIKGTWTKDTPLPLDFTRQD